MTTASKNRDITSNRVREFLSLMKNDVDNSKEMHKLGINTQLAERIEKFVVNPIESMIDTYSSVFTQLKTTMNDITLEYFKNHKGDIKKIFNASKPHDLTYYIVLKKDTFEVREKFFEFLAQYDTLGFQEKLPIIIKFLPERVLEKSDLKEEVILN